MLIDYIAPGHNVHSHQKCLVAKFYSRSRTLSEKNLCWFLSWSAYLENLCLLLRTLANGSELTTRLPTGKAIFWCTVYLTTPAAERFENGPEVREWSRGPEVREWTGVSLAQCRTIDWGQVTKFPFLTEIFCQHFNTLLLWQCKQGLERDNNNIVKQQQCFCRRKCL